MRDQLTRLIDDRRVPIKRCVCFGGSFSCGIMLGRHIGDGGPLRFAVYSIKRLIPRVRECEKTIRPFLNRRFWSGERNQWNHKQQERIRRAHHGLEVSPDGHCRASAPLATSEPPPTISII